MAWLNCVGFGYHLDVEQLFNQKQINLMQVKTQAVAWYADKTGRLADEEKRVQQNKKSKKNKQEKVSLILVVQK